jgi:hypothetical protein
MGAGRSRPVSDFHPGGSSAEFDVHGFHQSLAQWLKPYRLECSKPFLVRWYNEARERTADGTQNIEAPPAAVAFAIYSVPDFLSAVSDFYNRTSPTKNFVDAATNEILDKLRGSLRPELDPWVVNTDDGPPYYHVQTLGAVAGVDQHLEAYDFTGAANEEWREDLSDRLEECRDTKMWGTDPETLRKIFGVNVHPEWGGWYAYRGLIVLRGGLAETLQKPEPLNFLAESEARRIIAEYNLRHAECLWRDSTETGHPPERRYTTDEFFFFTEVSPNKRRRWLQLRKDTMEREEALASAKSHRFMLAVAVTLGLVAVMGKRLSSRT